MEIIKGPTSAPKEPCVTPTLGHKRASEDPCILPLVVDWVTRLMV